MDTQRNVVEKIITRVKSVPDKAMSQGTAPVTP